MDLAFSSCREEAAPIARIDDRRLDPRVPHRVAPAIRGAQAPSRPDDWPPRSGHGLPRDRREHVYRQLVYCHEGHRAGRPRRAAPGSLRPEESRR